MKKGFTLVELLVVITILGLLVVIAVPASLTISKKVKSKMYDSKIELIEKEAILWGQENKKTISRYDCSGISYMCVGKNMGNLVTENAIEPDSEDNKIINPTNDADMSRCVVYVYIKNNRVYAEFQKELFGDQQYKAACSPAK